MIQFSVTELAKMLGLRFEGNPELCVRGLKGLADAGPEELSFFAQDAYRDQLKNCRAGALLIREKDRELAPATCTLLIAEDPYLCFARALASFHPEQVEGRRGQDPSASVSPDAKVHEDCWIGPHVTVEAAASIGAGSILESHIHVGRGVQIGESCTIRTGCVLRHGTRIGNRVLIQNNAVLGSEGFGFVPRENATPEKIPQVGGVLVEDDVEIGANCCIDRGTMDDTVLRRGAKLDNLIQIAHNVEIGAGTVIAAQTGIAGSTRIGQGVMIGGAASITGHARIGNGVKIGGRSGVTGSIPDGRSYAGFPARPHREFLLETAAMHRLPELMKRLRGLERKLEELESSRPQHEAETDPA